MLSSRTARATPGARGLAPAAVPQPLARGCHASQSNKPDVSAAASVAVVEAKPVAVAKPEPVVKPIGPRLLTPEQQANLNARQISVSKHFPGALGVDDFISRLEVALGGFGFTGDNTIACTNLCRDEVTVPLKDKIESVFGGSFNINGLGGVLTCGVTGIGAGLSHSPICDGKEHYVFFAFPHIAINSAGEVGAITRPGRPNKSCACGALAKALGELKAEGYECNCKVPGVHDPLDPEYSILKQRLARRARYEKINVNSLDLVEITHLAERTISTDMEFLAEKVCDTRKANYAVVTGVQIHNWATELTPESGIPSLEFVAVAQCYVVVDGVKKHIDLRRVPPLSPRQLQLVARASITSPPSYTDSEVAISKTAHGTLKEVPLGYLTQRLGVTKNPEDFEDGNFKASGWTNVLVTEGSWPDANVPTMNSNHYTSFSVPNQRAGSLPASSPEPSPAPAAAASTPEPASPAPEPAEAAPTVPEHVAEAPKPKEKKKSLWQLLF